MPRKLSLSVNRPVSGRHSWHGMAFIMEALVLIVFIVFSTVILMQLFSTSRSNGEHAHAMSHAVTLATNEAERFAADPYPETVGHFGLVDGALVPVEASSSAEGSFTVTRKVWREDRPGGVLFHADITVQLRQEVLYSLSSTRYMTAREVSR